MPVMRKFLNKYNMKKKCLKCKKYGHTSVAFLYVSDGKIWAECDALLKVWQRFLHFVNE